MPYYPSISFDRIVAKTFSSLKFLKVIPQDEEENYLSSNNKAAIYQFPQNVRVTIDSEKEDVPKFMSVYMPKGEFTIIQANDNSAISILFKASLKDATQPKPEPVTLLENSYHKFSNENADQLTMLINETFTL